MEEMYFSLDIEADGRIPGKSSMLSLGSAAFTPDGKLVRTYEANLCLLPGAIPDPETTAWWAKHPEAWKHARENARDPREVMQEFHEWVLATASQEECTYEPVPVAYPGAYDYMWVYWYLIFFLGKAPFSYSCVDIKTMAMDAMGLGYTEVSKRKMPGPWFEGAKPHSHQASDDAWGQGNLFFAIRDELKRLREGAKQDIRPPAP